MPTVAPLDIDGHCLAAVFLNDIPFFAFADGAVHRLDHGHKTVQANDGLLCTALDTAANRLVTAGEDGKVFAAKADGTAEELASAGKKWITCVAAGPQGAVAYGAGRNAFVRFADGKVKEFSHPRSVEGIAFAPKGMRIAVARYNGATLHFPAADGKPTELEWAGAHTGATFSPDGAFLVTAMQENALHGWKLADCKHMRMSGYPAKVKSLSWAAKGKWLASSGAPAAIVWPFQGKDGPMGKAPLELGTRGDAMVTCVSCHPSEEVVAIGYDDGMVLASRFADAKEVLLRRPGKGAVTALMWDGEGRRIAFGTAVGDCGVIDIAG
ncbi:MAG: WD40 repeat domain-containing protein [Mesorhizobium sp.]|nr:WD40 repeat domain-containing protein [Mesorhizobium sp.]MBN9241684.1 WD40 repeat domain-containing protein [Mesorhizobium sp.]MBN9275356.1 WD40 repeat domain-containing protein [Mesorhizobium sp.]